jgi:hypothetical protein
MGANLTLDHVNSTCHVKFMNYTWDQNFNHMYNYMGLKLGLNLCNFTCDKKFGPM